MGRGRRVLLVVLRVLLLSYIGFALMLLALQRQLIYYPVRVPEALLLPRAEEVSLQPWRDAEGRFLGWRTPPTPEATRRMVVFHGNAGHALQRSYFADLLRIAGGGATWDVFLFEYPGYGARPGEPGEEEIVREAVAATDALLRDEERPLYLLGESLGCAVATAVARARPDRIAGLLLVTPFNNLADVARHHYPFLPVRLLLQERYPSDENLQRYAGPVAFVLVAEDEVVPLRLGRKLYDGYEGPKRLWVLDEVGHNTISFEANAPWWRDALRFLLQESGG